MPTAPVLTEDQIAICRELLLTEITSGKGKRATQKEALKKMLSVVLAARNAGISFETICAVMHRAGISITVETLKKYYFELRKELEIAIAEKAHAKRVAAAKASIESKLIVREAHKVGQSSRFDSPQSAKDANADLIEENKNRRALNIGENGARTRPSENVSRQESTDEEKKQRANTVEPGAISKQTEGKSTPRQAL